jgi:hypothetical protein
MLRLLRVVVALDRIGTTGSHVLRGSLAKRCPPPRSEKGWSATGLGILRVSKCIYKGLELTLCLDMHLPGSFCAAWQNDFLLVASCLPPAWSFLSYILTRCGGRCRYLQPCTTLFSSSSGLPGNLIGLLFGKLQDLCFLYEDLHASAMGQGRAYNMMTGLQGYAQFWSTRNTTQSLLNVVWC